MRKIFLNFAFVGLIFSNDLSAENTELGKITFTEGHYSPSCRTVEHKENVTGLTKTFRIKKVDGDDDVSSIVLAALMANRDVKIWYDELVTSGCGDQPQISYVRIY